MAAKRKQRRRSRARQQVFGFRTHGGKRHGAGRKPKGERAEVRHESRAGIDRRTPLLVTVAFERRLGYLRRHKVLKALRSCLLQANGRFDTRFCEYSLQGDHAHFMVETTNRETLHKAMTGFSVRLARRLNKLRPPAASEPRRVFRDRYHHRALTTPRAVRNGLSYVLNNSTKHAGQHLNRYQASYVDVFSSAGSFNGWKRQHRQFVPRAGPAETGVSLPRTWRLTTGWRKAGLIGTDESPRVIRRSG